MNRNIITSIIIGSLIIAGALVYLGSQIGLNKGSTKSFGEQLESYQKEREQEQIKQEQERIAQLDETAKLVNPLSSDDHIRGSKDARVIIFEYSDFECPFCKRFHNTLAEVLEEYNTKSPNSVAWVYRHFPLEQLHPEKAYREAIASECAADQGGSDMFWAFADRFMELTPSNNQTNLDVVLPQIVSELGLDEAKFNTCLNSDQKTKKVNKDIQNALETGGQGTPWSIVVTKDGQYIPVNGALPVEMIRELLDSVLLEK